MKQKISKSRLIVIITSILVVILVIGGVIAKDFYQIFSKTQQIFFPTSNQTTNTPKTSSQLLTRLSQLMIVPEDKPTIIVLKNVDELKQLRPEFSQNVETGDVLFLFETQAVVYSPRRDRVVSVAPLKRTSNEEKTEN